MGKERRFYPLSVKSGIQKDGSENEGNYYIGGNWMRFQRGLAETMGGITAIDDLFFKNKQGIYPKSKNGNYLTNMKAFSWDGQDYLFISYTSFQVAEINEVGFYILKYNLNGDPNQSISYTDFIYYHKEQSSAYPYLYDTYFLFEGPFTLDVDDDLNPGAKKFDSPFFYAQLVADSSNILNNTKSSLFLLPFAKNSSSLNDEDDIFRNQDFIKDFTSNYNFNGGVRVQNNLFVAFGNGSFIYSKYPDFRKSILTAGTENAKIVTEVDPLSGSNQKIIQGYFTRGGGNSPCLLFWSLTSLIRVMNVNGTEGEIGFSSDIISNNCSIMSRDCVVEYDGLFYWMGVDRFFVYNGTVQELPNTFNQNDVFENIDLSQRMNVIGIANPKYGEIWWFYPDKRYAPYYYDPAIEDSYTPFDGNTAAVVYNKRENCWYSLEYINRDAVAFSLENGFLFTGGCDNYLQKDAKGDPAPPKDYNYEKNYQQIYVHDTPLMVKKSLNYDMATQMGQMQWYPVESTLEAPFFSWKYLSPGQQFVGENKQINLVAIEPDVNFKKFDGYEKFWDDTKEDTCFKIEVSIQTKKFLMKSKTRSSELRYIKSNTTQLTYSNTSSGYLGIKLHSTTPYKIATFLLQFEFEGEK